MPFIVTSAPDSLTAFRSHSLSLRAPLAYNPTVGSWSARILRRVYSRHGCLRDRRDPGWPLGLDKTLHQSPAVNTVPDSNSTDVGRPSERPAGRANRA
ncbi:hypothetical protein RhiJN_04383 [Ceratobasidium sp. AG-Ba]|nr:hypothetical protein RhiJN_04383 [Ceratobasidium sp. AG-Ba]QRW05272.1 hypothetical protein RhiLY_04271 [Ceratobasidium sp. AG-Ba]